MIKSAIEYLSDLRKPVTIKVDGKTFYDAIYSPAKDIYPATLKVHNLTGIFDYLTEKPEVVWNGLFIHIEDFNNVILYQSMTGPFNQREPIIISLSRPFSFPFNEKMSLEKFIISLRALFVDNDDREYLLKFISGIKVDASATIKDDGVSQKIIARQGTSSLMSQISIKPVVRLRPFRTFTEIEQPESEFVFRLGTNSDKEPVASLYECDGEAWKQTAIENIKAWFKDKGVAIPIIA